MKKFTSALFVMICAMVAACSSSVGNTEGQEDSAELSSADTATEDTAVRPDSVPADAEGPTVTVSLSDTYNPPGETVPRNACGVLLATFDFTRNALLCDGCEMSRLQIRRVGIGSPDDFENLYLVDVLNSDGSRLASGHGIDPATNLVTFNGLHVPLQPRYDVHVMLIGDVRNPVTGGQHSFEIADASSVGTNGGLTVLGSFPVRGNVFTMGTAYASEIDVQRGTQPPDPIIGAPHSELSRFVLSNGDHTIRSMAIVLQQAGSIADTDIDLSEVVAGDQTGRAYIYGRHVILTFDPYLEIAAGSQVPVSIFGQVRGPAGRTIRIYMEYPMDLYAQDTTLRSTAAVCISSLAIGGCRSAGFGSFDGGAENFSQVTTRGE